MPSKRMAGNLLQAWQALAHKPSVKEIPSFVVLVPQLLAAFASHSVAVSLVDTFAFLYLEVVCFIVCCLHFRPSNIPVYNDMVRSFVFCADMSVSFNCLFSNSVLLRLYL